MTCIVFKNDYFDFYYIDIVLNDTSDNSNVEVLWMWWYDCSQLGVF